MELPQSLNLYITFIEKEGPFLKVWGQTEKNNAIYVEQFLSGISPQFNAGLSRVSPETLQSGTLVCAKYEDNKYYRARLINIFIRESIVEVTFIDFGNRHIISLENIRSLQDCPSSFISIPPLAIGFIFAEAHCVGGGEWNDTIFESISKEFRFREVQCHLLSQATQYYLVKLYLDTTDLCNLLIQRGLMQPISLQAQQAVLLSMSIQRQTAQAPPPTTQAAAAINTYKAVTLEPGCLYPVYVSYINDGPCHFSVQLKQSEEILAKLMKDINCVTLRLLEDVPIPGTLCLARCQEDGNVCRAVVTNEVDNQFKVYYVDFGNYEIVSLDSLFQIPFKYVIPKVMAIRYTLAGVEKSTVTIEMQVAFKKFVDNRMLHMKVLPTLTRVAVPKCELWDPENKTSALEVVNRAAQHAYPEPIPLTRGFSQPVKVSFVYSCNRFYVQLVSKEKELSNLMLELQEICQTSSPIEASDIKTGLPCCALFLADSLWYRSQVVEVLGETVKVRYIDFGNEEDVHINLLKSIDGEQLTVLRPQAIECCLNGYQNMGDDPERDGLLEEIILEDTFTMKVIEMVGKKVLVELFDLSNYNVASLLLDKIAAAKSQASPMLVQAGNKIEHRKSLSHQREGQTPHRDGYSQQREGPRDDYRGDREIKSGRDDSNWNSKPNDRIEKPWRQDNRETRSFDKNSNENDERNSWRDNNKGFSPNHQRQNRQKSQEGDSWNNSNNDANSNSGWNTPETNQSNTNTVANDEWNSPSNDEGARQNRRQDDYGKNRRGFDNDRGSKYDNDRGSKYDNDRGSKYDNDRGSKYDNDRGSKYDNDRGSKYDNDRGSKFDNDRGDRHAGKKWDGGYGKKPDYRKDDSQLSPNGPDQSYHKGPRTSSRNDRGGRGGKFERNYDKPRGASFTNNSLGDDSWNVSAVVPSIDAAPASASFTPLEVVGTEAKVIISWFHHPCHFFCQIADSQDQFKVMMEEIQEFYKNRKPEQAVVGAPVIGLFPEDNVLYRAQVLEMTGSSYKVYYVDFGNVSTIQKVWPIDLKFMNLPAQAIVCSLNGIAPLADNWSDPDSFSKYFERENFTCSFINKDEEKTYVNILYESEDIAQLLIQDGLAVSTLAIIPDIEIPLLLNQQFRAVLKSVNNLSDIIIALECGLAVSCTMHNLEAATETFEDQLRGLLEQTVIVYVDNVIDDRLEITLYDTEGYKIVVLNPDEGAMDSVELPCPMLVLRSSIAGYVPYADQKSVFIQPLEYSELVEYLLEQLFAAYNDQPQECTICPEEQLLYVVHSEDGNWYRGRVLSCDDEKATVCFVDYGNSEEVAFSELRELASEFLEIPFLSLQVKVPSDATAFIDKEVAGNIIYGEEGWEGTIEIIESSATEFTIEDVGDTGYTSSSLEKPDDVRDNNESSTYVADEVVVEVADGILDAVNLSIPVETAVPNIEENVVPTREDGEMQEHLDKEDAEVENVVVTFEEGESPQHLDTETEVESSVVTIKDGEMQQHLNEDAEVKNIVPTVEDGEIQQHLDDEVENVVATLENGEMQQNLEVENAVQSLEDGEMQQLLDETVAIGTPVYTSHVDTPNEFYLQFHDAVSEIEELQEGIQTGAPEWSVIENPAAGIICAAPYSGDQKWYRAVILDADDDITTVRFMDFGNTDVIDNKTTQIKMLPPNLLSLAVYATRCSLKLEPLDEEWSSSATTLFEELAMSGNVTAEFLDQNEKTNYVELYSDGVNIREELIQRKLAITSTQTEETKSTGFVSHLNSPSEFWIQLENCVDELEWIAEQLSSAESFEELEDLAPGTLCAALFPDDTMWYRARILSNTVAGIELLFIDYGNSCTSSSLRQLPEDLVVTAPLAQKCSLQKPEGIPTWSAEAAAKFREISAEGQTIFTVKKISTGETSIVQLFVGEDDVSTMLLPVTEDGFVKAVDSLERLQIENADGEPIEGSFQLEAMNGQELNEEAEQKFEQINEQGSTLFQIEFIGNNIVRLYLNGSDIRPQLGGMKNTSVDSSKIEEDLESNGEVKVSEEHIENDKLESSIQDTAEKNIHGLNDADSPEMKLDSDENRFSEEPHSDSVLPQPISSSLELVEEPVIVDQKEASPSVEDNQLEGTVHLTLEVDAEPTDITSIEETQSHNSVQDSSKTLNVDQCEPPEASTAQSNDMIERSTQTDDAEYETLKLSEITGESEIVESLQEGSPVYSVTPPVANLNQEQQNEETLQDISPAVNTGEYKPPTSTASSEGLHVSEYPKESSPSEGISVSPVKSPEDSSSQQFENDDTVQVSTASPEESMLEESTEISSPVDLAVSSPVKPSVASSNQENQNNETVHNSSQTTNSAIYKPPTSTASPEESNIRESPKMNLQNDDTLQKSSQILNNIEDDPRTSTASLEDSVEEESPKRPFPVEHSTVFSSIDSPQASCNQECQNNDTVQDSFRTLDTIEYEPHSPIEINTDSVESPVASSNYDIPIDDTVQDSSKTLNSAEESSVEESPVEDTIVSSPVESSVLSSCQERQNDDSEQDSFQTLDINKYDPHSTARTVESIVRFFQDYQKKSSLVGDNTASAVVSPVASSNYELQDNTVQDSSQAVTTDKYEPHTVAVSTEDSVEEESPKKSSVEDVTASDTVQDSSQVESTDTYEPNTSSVSTEESVEEKSLKKSSVEDSTASDTVQDSSQAENTGKYEPHTSAASTEESVEEESPKTSSVKGITASDTVQYRSQVESTGKYEPHTSSVRTEESVEEESPKKSPVEDSTASNTVQDSSQAENTGKYEPHTSSVSTEESVIEESPKKSSFEDITASNVKSPEASSNYEIKNDGTVQDRSQAESTEPHIPSVITEELVVEESPKKSSFEDISASDVKLPEARSSYEVQNDGTVQDSSQIESTGTYEPHISCVSTEESMVECSPKKSYFEDITASNVESPEASSNYEIHNEDTVQDNSQAESTEPHISSVSTEELVLEESPKKSSVEGIIASNVKSPVASPNQDPQIGDTIQDNLQRCNTDNYDSPSSTANPEKSEKQKSPKNSSTDTYVAISTIISPEVSSSSLEVPTCSKTLGADEPPSENVLEETGIKLSSCVEQLQLNANIADRIVVLENNSAAPDNVQNSSDSGNESCPTTPQKILGVAAPTNSPVGAQVPHMQLCLFDDITIGSSSQNIQDNDVMQGDIVSENVISQEKSFEEGGLPNEVLEKIHFAGPSASEILESLEESTNTTLTEADQIDSSSNDLAQTLESTESQSSQTSPENVQESSTEMDITIPLNLTLGNGTVQTLKDTHSDDYSESQEPFAETKLSKLTISEQTSQEPSEGQLSTKNDETEQDITVTVPMNECSIIKPSVIPTDEITQTLVTDECEVPASSSKKVKKPSCKPVVCKDAKETSNKSCTVKFTASPFKSPIRVSLSVAKVLASKKDEISSPATITKKAKGPVISKKDVKKDGELKKSCEEISLGIIDVETSDIDTEIEKNILTESVHNAEEKSSATSISDSDQMCQAESQKTEINEVESSSLHSDLNEMKAVEVIEQEEN